MDGAEIESILVRLTGDGSSYQNMLQTAQTSVQQASSVIGQASATVQGYGQALGQYAGMFMSTMAGLGILGQLKGALGSFENREKIVIKLTAAIEANGEAVESTMAEYRRFAGVMGKETTFGGLGTLGLLQQAEAMGMVGEQAERAVKNAIAYEAATGRAAGGILRITMAMERGQANMIGTRFFMQQLQGLPAAEKLIKAQELLNKQFVTAQEVAKTTAGQLRLLDFAWIGFRADLGEVIADGIKPVIGWLRELASWFKNLSPSVKLAIVATASLAAGLLVIGPSLAKILFFVTLSLNPISLLLVAIGSGLAAWVGVMGGVEKGWQQIGDAVSSLRLSFTEFYHNTVESLQDWVANNRKVALSIGLVAGAVLGAVVAFKLATVAVGFLAWAYTVLHIQQVAGIAAALVWKSVMLLASGVMLIFNAQFFIWNQLLGLAFTLQGLWAASSVVATAATWLWNAALAVMDTLLSPVFLATAAVSILAIAGTIVVVAAATVLVGSSLYAVWQAASSVMDVLTDIPTISGPLNAVGNVFRQWYDILHDVIHVAAIDMPMAWNLLQAGFKLAVSQVADLWPPLWTFIQKGFTAVWNLAAITFELRFEQALKNVSGTMLKQFSVFGMDPLGINKELEAYNSTVGKALTASAGLVGSLMKDALVGFDKNYVESDATKKAREAVAAVDVEVQAAIAKAAAASQVTADAAKKGLPVPTPPGKATAPKEVKPEPAVLFGSAEAKFRISEYLDAVSGKTKEQEQVDILKEIRDGIQNLNDNQGDGGLGFADVGPD